MSARRENGLQALQSHKRLVVLSLFVAVLFSLLIIRFYFIQVVEGEKWTKRALAQHFFTATEPARRGTFYSNTTLKLSHPEPAKALVADVAKFHLFVDPKAIPEPAKKQVAAMLAKTLKLTDEDGKKVLVHLNKNCRSRKVLMWMSRQKRQEIESWWLPFAKSHKIPRNAVYFVQDFKRSYPYGKLLGQVLHTVREDRDPTTHKHIPTGGLELVLDSYLQGKDGKRKVMRSPKNPLDFGTLITTPVHGADIHLTINHYIQAVAEEEIAKAVKKASAKSGWLIMMDPATGEIFAWAQYPFFDPGQYKTYFNNPSMMESTKLKALTDPYEPGSTMKPLTIALCLKANQELRAQGRPPIFSQQERIATANGNFPGRSSPIRDTKLHRYLTMDMAIQKSSNIYMSRMIQRVVETLGDQWYRDALQNIFGFGVKTGVEFSSESIGLLPSPGKKHPNGTLEWSTPTPFSLAFGHNLLVSSLQMLKSYAVLCNGGYDVQPTLIKKIVKQQEDGTKKILLDNDAKRASTLRKRLLDSDICDEVVRAMKYVTKPGGSAYRADIWGYSEAGKTATSEKIVNGRYSRKNHISTFVGFAPAKNPRFVMLIAIDEPEHKYIPGIGKMHMGGACAAPVFAEVGSRVLQYLGVEPDDPFGYPVGDPRRDPEKGDWIKEANILQKKYIEWNS